MHAISSYRDNRPTNTPTNTDRGDYSTLCGSFASALSNNTTLYNRLYIRNWRAPQKNGISSTSMKLRKSLVKPVTWQNIYLFIHLRQRARIGHWHANDSKLTHYKIRQISMEFFHPRSSCTTHLMLFSERPPTYASCMTISGGRTKQLDIFCRVTGFTSDFRTPQTSTDICVARDDLGWKNRTTRCNRFWRAGCSRLEYADIRLVY